MAWKMEEKMLSGEDYTSLPLGNVDPDWSLLTWDFFSFVTFNQ